MTACGAKDVQEIYSSAEAFFLVAASNNKMGSRTGPEDTHDEATKVWTQRPQGPSICLRVDLR